MAIFREDYVDIDLAHGGIFRSYLNHAIGKGDKMENRFGVRLFRDGEAVSVSGCSVQGYFMAPNGENIAITGSSYTGKSGNLAWVQLPQACYDYEGQFTLAIKVLDTNVTGTMRIVDGVVNNTGVTGAVAPTNSVPTYQEVLAVYEAAAGIASITPTEYYIANGGNGVTWSASDPVMLTLDDNDHFLYVNGTKITITKAQILTAASAEPELVTVSGNTIRGHTYCLYYKYTTSEVKCAYGNDQAILSKYPVLFAVHYSSLITGLIVDYINNKVLTKEINSGSGNAAKNALDYEYAYFDITIPAGTDANINQDISGIFANGLQFVSLYYSANSGVYSGNVRIDKAGYADTIYLDANEQKKTSPFKPTWIRLYYNNMTKSGGSVVGGTVRIYYKYVVSLEDPNVDGMKLSAYIQDQIENKVPSYFRTHLATKIASARTNMMDVGRNGETFVFITDPHWETNAKNSPALVQSVLENLNINAMLCGGDLINQGEFTPMVETMIGCITAFQFKNVLFPCAFGNHDSNWNDWDGQREHPERYFNAKKQYALMQKQAEGIVTYFTDTGWNFYIDAVNTKTRYIVLDTGEDGTFSAYTQLISCLNGTPSGYHIVIMAHWLYENSSRTTACVNIETLIDAYNSRGSGTVGGASYNFASAGGEIFLLLGGHYHNDRSWTTTGGVPVVLTDTDSNRTNNTTYPYVAGTITEQAFDIFTIDYDTKAVKAVRVGRGADRSWTRS